MQVWKCAATRMLWSTDKVRAKSSQDRTYTKQFNKKTKLSKQNGRWSNYRPGPYRELAYSDWRKINMNFEEKIKKN